MQKIAAKIRFPLDFHIRIFYNLIYTILFIFNIIPIENIYPFHIISIICNFYSLYFVSKLIVMVEKKYAIKVKDYIGTFVAAWFYLIGIWWIQPRVKKLFLPDDK